MSQTTPQVVTVVIDGDPNRLLSTQGFISDATDTPPNAVFLPRLRDTIEYSREVGCSVWGNSKSQAALGVIDIDNTDGALDFWLAEQWRDRIVTIRRGLATLDYDAHEHVAFAVIDRNTTPDWYVIRFSLRDKGALLDVALQTAMYPALIQAPSLEGTPRPVCIGVCEGVPLTMVDAGNLQYDVHDTTDFEVEEVTDQGVILSGGVQWEQSTESTTFGITRLTNPAGKQVAQVHGEGGFFFPFLQRLPAIIPYLLGRSDGRVYPTDIDPYSVDDLDAVAPYDLCYWGRDNSTISSVLTRMLDSFTGWWYFDRDGLLRVGRLIDPADSGLIAVVELSDINLIGDITMRLDEAKGLSDSVGCVPNWSPHGPGDLAGSVTGLEPARAQRLMATQQVRKGVNVLHPTYAQAVGADPIKTLLSNVTDGQTEADRITALYAVERYFYDVTAAMEGSLSYTLEPGQIVLLTSDRFGLANGKPLMVVAVKTRLMSSVVSLTLWGAGPDAGDFPTGT